MTFFSKQNCTKDWTKKSKVYSLFCSSQVVFFWFIKHLEKSNGKIKQWEKAWYTVLNIGISLLSGAAAQYKLFSTFFVVQVGLIFTPSVIQLQRINVVLNFLCFHLPNTTTVLTAKGFTSWPSAVNTTFYLKIISSTCHSFKVYHTCLNFQQEVSLIWQKLQGKIIIYLENSS